MRRLSNYKDYIIATSVSGLAGGPFEASFVISRSIGTGAEETIPHRVRLARTFAFSEEARAAADQAAQACVDSLSAT